MALVGSHSHIHNTGNCHVGAGECKQTLPAGLLRALQFHTSQHDNMLGFSRHIPLDWKKKSITIERVNGWL
jgi:hypothetical protein